MQRIIISTIIRNTPADKPSGSLITFDLSSCTTIQKSTIIEPPHREKDKNMRGGIRGLRGIAVQDNQIILANATEVFRYDCNWQLLGRFSHPSCSGIHDILIQNDTVWITSSRNDLLFQFRLDGDLINYFDLRQYSNRFKDSRWKPSPFLSADQIYTGKIDFRNPATHNHQASDSAHLNGVDLLPNGHLIISFGMMLNNRMEAWLRLKNWLFRHAMWKHVLVANHWMKKFIKNKSFTQNELIIHPASAECAVVEIDHEKNFIPLLLLRDITVPGHSIRILKDGTAVFLNTSKGEIIHFHPQLKKIISTTVIGSGFLRGARQLSDGGLLLGDNQRLMLFDIVQQKILAQYTISDNSNESVYDINILPDHFDLPPLSFL